MRGDRYEEQVRQLRRDALEQLSRQAASAVAKTWYAAIGHFCERCRLLACGNSASSRQLRISE